VIENSVIGVRSQIGENVTIRNSYIMGIDSYQTPKQIESDQRAKRPQIGIGAGTRIENAIIDKNPRIGRDVAILNEAGISDSEEHPHYVIRDKIVVIPKFTILQDGTVI
jgi:glucose-1-phosphate adenylyltransferase